MAGHKDEAQDRYRLDKWLWAVRFYKTRRLAQEAIAAGHVDVNGDGVKPSRAIRVGDVVTLRLNQVNGCCTSKPCPTSAAPPRLPALSTQKTKQAVNAVRRGNCCSKPSATAFPIAKAAPTAKRGGR